LVTVLEALAEIAYYEGDLDRVLALTGEAIRVAGEAGSEIWSAGLMNYEAFVSLARGDVESALRVLTEGDEVLASHDEKILRVWNLDALAAIAVMQERLDDAFEIRTRQVKMARKVGYRRVLGSALTGLGSVHAAAGRLEEAKNSYLDGLEIFEHTGQAPDMAVIVIYLARSERQSGNREHAVELLACVQGDPVRGQQFAAEGQTIEEVAQTELSSLASLMPDDTYAAAFQTGASKSLGISVKELLSGTDRLSEPR
jgi:ATP/maltotriose-dependent transcriptional regulator MalT